MSALSGHIVVKSCGLCILYDNVSDSVSDNIYSSKESSFREHSSRVVELSVREISTPVGTPYNNGTCSNESGGYHVCISFPFFVADLILFLFSF